MKKLLLALLMLLTVQAGAAFTFGADATNSSNSTADTRSDALTLGQTGTNSILIVHIVGESAFSTPVVIYGLLTMTAIASSLYSGSATLTEQTFYLLNPASSGLNLSIVSGSPTTLGQVGSKTWRYQYFTYGGVSNIGTTSINNSNFTTSASGSPVTVAFNFTPSTSTSLILQILYVQSASTCANTYAAVNGTNRIALSQSMCGAFSFGFGMSDYAPGSTSTYSLSQSFNPQFCTNTGYGWGFELLAVGGGGATGPPTGSQMMMGMGM